MRSPRRLWSIAAARGGAGYRSLVRLRSKRALRDLPSGSAVQLGSGGNNWAGWVNVDLSPTAKPDIVLDLRGGFPCPRERVRYFYSEHVLEHLDLADAKLVLADLHAGLQPGGVLRIAMPDLDSLIDSYRGAWRDQPWLDDPAYEHIDSPTHMINYGLRSWGHKYVYGLDELRLRLQGAGFKQVDSMPWGESEVPLLTGLETRPDSLLIVEARR